MRSSVGEMSQPWWKGKGTFEGWHGTWLRWCDREGNLLPTGEEQRERAETAEAQVREQRERAEHLQARLRELGLDG